MIVGVRQSVQGACYGKAVAQMGYQMAPAPGLDLVESSRADVHLHSAPVDFCSELGAQSFKSRHLNMSVGHGGGRYYVSVDWI